MERPTGIHSGLAHRAGPRPNGPTPSPWAARGLSTRTICSSPSKERLLIYELWELTAVMLPVRWAAILYSGGLAAACCQERNLAQVSSRFPRRAGSYARLPLKGPRVRPIWVRSHPSRCARPLIALRPRPHKPLSAHGGGSLMPLAASGKLWVFKCKSRFVPSDVYMSHKIKTKTGLRPLLKTLKRGWWRKKKHKWSTTKGHAPSQCCSSHGKQMKTFGELHGFSDSRGLHFYQ